MTARLTLAAALLAAAAGCSLGGRDLGPDNNRQLEAAQTLRLTTPPEPPRELERTPHGPHLLEAGDSLLVQPSNIESAVRLPNDQVVQPDGSIDLGKYGRLFVGGRTLTEVEAAVQQAVRLREKADTKEDPGFIDVRLVGRTSKVYYVLGEVNTPGAFPLIGRETVLDAILAAGGVTERASVDRIGLSRPTRPGEPRRVLPVCYSAIAQLADTSTNYQILPGDRVFVPSKAFAEGFLGKKKPNACPGCEAAAAPAPAPTPGVTLDAPPEPDPVGPELRGSHKWSAPEWEPAARRPRAVLGLPEAR